jgi:heme-degrading monooxygenase HmoA
MAVLVIADIPGATVEQYEAVSRALGFRDPDFEPPAGLISHTAGVNEDGILIVDEWDSAEDFEWLMERAVPAMQEAGAPPIEPRIVPVHHSSPGRGRRAGVLLLMETPGFGTREYDEVIQHMPSHAGDGPGHPAVSHTAGISDDGLVIVDVWDSPEAFGHFAETELGPAAGQAGHDLSGVQPRIVPVHYRLTGKS